MKHLFVTQEVAKKLQEIGFEEPCLAYYKNGELYAFSQLNGKKLTGTSFKIRLCAPIWQQVTDWLKTKGFSIKTDYLDSQPDYYLALNETILKQLEIIKKIEQIKKTHSEQLIEKWENKIAELINKSDELIENKIISSASEIICHSGQILLIEDFITDLNQSILIKEFDLLPNHYKPIDIPLFNGVGNHSVSQLEKVIGDFLEYFHYLKIREQLLIKLANIKIVK